ncbi:hypothetical protein HMPREF9440_01841 [Sutterella parvirubra YIT 11816]|uniref:Uncharacterized protein n=1 Tax=Sutterella parvirubra YIT 11816 TaxID=762967 RepID=H3KGG1_9BURK|nr:hypothetical protein HMPREF9440_01841 [Sutterella parvirubra YIT 11816]
MPGAEASGIAFLGGAGGECKAPTEGIRAATGRTDQEEHQKHQQDRPP